MNNSTTKEQTIKENVNAVLNLLSEGKFLDAMNEYLADDVILREGNNEPKVGKEFCIRQEEELLATVTAFHGYEVVSGPAVKGDTSFYEAVMKFDTADGQKHTFEQVVRTKWNDAGKIIEERYYHS
ncbi:hypothetical protein [Aquimarina spongiae]|uniref:SnoaL-like domain-containing protein n=1 Tax=Aquimarina spongiae TaxID=570521 RepID=A0A1M6AL11_9FLAO|nr:hypothetical protein [Aquimarina spongiae]SHI37152.1 hypothetical protein SAMN04488508_101349 [Aquimarina spongiae]